MKILFRIFFFTLSILCYQKLIAQTQYPQNYFSSPLDIPLKPAGSFGELRSNHFHSGIDLRTQEKEGLNVYAPADGYVSRIRVSAWGFGNALYITHPNGYVTVYGHLKSYNPKITAYLRKMQYIKESFELDLPLPRNKIIIKKGEIIALSGNTGGSEGPHLHFEIRERKKEIPINPLLFGLKIEDSIPPVIEGVICFDEISGNHFNLEVKGLNGNYYINTQDTLLFPAEFSLGIATYDLMKNNTTLNGIYQMELILDSTLIQKITFEKFSFNETRYVNCLINYPAYIETGKKYQQSKILPGNKLSIYDTVQNKGIIKLSDNDLHQIRYKVSDFEGNCSYLSFTVKRGGEILSPAQNNVEDSNLLISYNLADTFRTENMKLFFPANALYDDLILKVKETKDSERFLSNSFEIQENTIPIHKNISILIKTDSVADSLKSKLLIVRIKENGKLVSEGGKFIDGFVRASINIFGKFAVLIDTIAPTIKPLNYNQKTIYARQKTIDFRISDDLSGIAKYKATLNSKWILMEFDGKKSILTYTIDEKLKSGSNQLIITAEDSRKNISELNLIINK